MPMFLHHWEESEHIPSREAPQQLPVGSDFIHPDVNAQDWSVLSYLLVLIYVMNVTFCSHS